MTLFVPGFVKRDAAVELTAFDGQLSGHGIAEDVKLPVVPPAGVAAATERLLFGMIATRKRAHEVRGGVHDFVGVYVELVWVFSVDRNLVKHVLVMTGGIGDGTFGVAFPRADDFG